MKWTLYHLGTGEFGPILTGSDERVVEPHLSADVAAKEGVWHRDEYRVDPATGEIVPK